MCFVYTVTAAVLGQPHAGLSKEACLYAGANWLKLVIVSVNEWLVNSQLNKRVPMVRKLKITDTPDAED